MNKLLSFSRQLSFLILMFLPSLQMQGDPEFKGWTANDLSTLKGTGTLSDPYLISSAEDFATFAKAVYNGKSSFSGKYVKQTADISFNKDAILSGGGMSIDNVSEVTYALPIGSKWGWSSDYFEGTYDGGGHSLSGLYYATNIISNIQWMGVFGGLRNAIVKNLTIKDCLFNLSSESSIEDSFGVLAGRAEGSTITNCAVQNCSIVLNNDHDGTDIGGLVGHTENGANISKCKVSATIDCSASKALNAGGLVGYCKVDRSSDKGSVNVKDCTSSASIIIKPKLSRDINGFMLSGFLNTNLSADTETKLSTVNISGCTNSGSMAVYNPTMENGKNYKVTGMNINSFANYVDVIKECVDLSTLRFGENKEFKNATGIVVAPVGTVYDTMADCALYCSIYNPTNGDDQYEINEYPIYVGSVKEMKNCILINNRGKTVDSRATYYADQSQLTKDAESICQGINSKTWRIVWGVGADSNKFPIPVACGGVISSFNGNGTEELPYIIDSEATLRRLQFMLSNGQLDTEGKYFRLDADIDMTDSELLDAIGTEKHMFMGTFDGNGHAIIGLHTQDYRDNRYGLFGCVGGTIKNLALIGIYGKVHAPLVYSLSGSDDNRAEISNCYVGGDISCTTLIWGDGAGICYRAKQATIKNCYFKGTVNFSDDAISFSGICDGINNATIENCYASFEVSGTNNILAYGILRSDGSPSVTGSYACVDNHTPGRTYVGGAVKLVDSESELNGLMQSPFVDGIYRPVLPSTKHYGNIVYSYDERVSEVKEDGMLDALPEYPDNNLIMRYMPSDGEDYKQDHQLWKLPNLAVYDAEAKTDYLINCRLKPDAGYVYPLSSEYISANGLTIKGNMTYPLTLTGDADTYMLCLPGIVTKDNLPEGSRLMMVGTATETANALQANVVDCEYVPAGMPFMAYIPGTKGDVVDIVMRGEIAVQNRVGVKVNGTYFETGLTGSFRKWGGYRNTFDKLSGNQILKSDEEVPSNLPAFSSAFILQNAKFKWDAITLVDYILLDETSSDVDDVVNENDGKVVNVKLKRSLKAGSWNTICLPFNVSSDEMKEFGGEDTAVEELSSVENVDGVCTLRFKKAESIEAGKSYLVCQTADYPDVLEWSARIISKDVKPERFDVTGLNGFNTITFTGSFAPTYLEGNGSGESKCFIQGDKIYKVGDGQYVAMKGFRCWLTTSNTNAFTSARLVHVNGSTTDLRVVEVGTAADGSRIYDLQGIETLKPAKTGVYIKNGKKFMAK